MNQNLIPFSFDESHAVRVVIVDGAPWFVAADVAAALEYRDAFNMIRVLDDDEKGTQIVSTPGGDQQMQIINESGLYSAVLRSRKPEAKKFKRWVTHEVLPSIRKTGRYEAAAPEPTLSAEQQRALQQAVHLIAVCCKFEEKARFAVWENLRFLCGAASATQLRPAHFEPARAQLDALLPLARQHQARINALDAEFIEAVLRPPVSVRKVRALTRGQAAQGDLLA